jgi:feruloyl esterase
MLAKEVIVHCKQLNSDEERNMKKYAMAISVLAAVSLICLPSMGVCKTTAPSCTVGYFNSFGKSVNTTFIDATLEPAVTGTNPEYCLVHGWISTQKGEKIGIEISLPDKADWNQKLLETGNGGFAGFFQHYYYLFDPSATSQLAAIQRGYVLAETDTGHQDANLLDASWALNNPVAQEDFHYLAVHQTAVVAKAMISHYYGSSPKYSYFAGCSTGGRQAMESSQRYPDDFDGIISGAPAANVGAIIGFAWIQQLEWPDFVATATGGTPPYATSSTPTLPNSEMILVQNGVLAACDGTGPAADGFINDPSLCNFDPSTLLCPQSSTTNCLTAEQVAVAQRVYNGPQTWDAATQKPAQLYFGFARSGAEANTVGAGAWPVWVGDAGYTPYLGYPNAQYGFAQEWLQYFVFSDPNWQLGWFDFDSDYLMVDQKIGNLNSYNTNLSPFKAHKAKLLQYQGWADTCLTPLGTIDYYTKVVDRMGDVDGFYRLFMVPGMDHCGGGVGPNTVEWLTALEQWVENKTAPDSIPASGTSPLDQLAMQRPLCRYPKLATFNAKLPNCDNDRHNAACFTCQ